MTSRSGGMADATDSKSVVRKGVWVRLPPPAPLQMFLSSSINPAAALHRFDSMLVCKRRGSILEDKAPPARLLRYYLI